ILKALSNPAALSYTPDAKGLESARLAVAAYYAARGQNVSASDIILTTSTSEAYSFVFRLLCNPGDEFLIPEPSYPLFGFLAELHDVKLVRYPLVYDHGWQIDFHALDGAIASRTRGVIVVHPNNPTGNFVKPAEIARLNEICAAHQIAVIADEVFLDFALDGNLRHSFANNGDAASVAKESVAASVATDGAASSVAVNRGPLTFTTSGISKISGLPQMKAAWLTASGPSSIKTQALARLEVIADTFLSMNAPVQWAIPELLKQRHGFQRQVLARVRKNLVELDCQLAAQKLCSRLLVEGGWYAVLRVPATRSDEDLSLELLTKKSVYVHPGHFFDFPADGHLVVSLIAPEREFSEGIARLLSTF
ncbi:MAG: pyridoxal phosphate-dependent aminotransferase, partial [Candidatus Acidiferrales bacterium]